ncbi:hypothetical protein HY793_01490, partial [Candidatus Desantisbacteria bacterium]|nr:hypothetical protein [Candidatus Desantisbacteria bacterium]
TDAASDTGKNACATKAVSTGGATSLPQTKTTDAAVDKTTPADVKQGVDNGNSLRNTTNTRFKFIDIAPIDEGELLN